ncbi:MAG: iron-sulfur cluster assembly scaffold protein [Elusimicrobiota bacterium]|nr:iron-sulfur cluster assembly scaffold protein [Elusimicrobiota bacterium]
MKSHRRKTLDIYAEQALKNMGVVPGKIEDFDKLRKKVIDGLKKNYSDKAIRCFIEKKNYGGFIQPDAYAWIKGPCGDTMEFYLKVNKGRIKKAGFTTDGCESSVACGQIVSEIVIGKNIPEVMKLTQKKILAEIGKFPKESRHCALLAVNTAKDAVRKFREKE